MARAFWPQRRWWGTMRDTGILRDTRGGECMRVYDGVRRDGDGGGRPGRHRSSVLSARKRVRRRAGPRRRRGAGCDGGEGRPTGDGNPASYVCVRVSLSLSFIIFRSRVSRAPYSPLQPR